MDFHTLTRRQLQTLCKRNRIPANLTNVAMADALSALPAVEGMDEVSPSTKPVAAAGGGGASTCRRTATATATRRRTRQISDKMTENLDFSGTEEEVRKGFQSGEQYNNILPHHATPAPAPPASAAALVQHSRDTLTRGGAAQGIRRSTRLATKNSALAGKINANVDDDYNKLDTVVKKMDFGETRKGQEDSSSAYDVDLVAESLGGIDLNGKSEEGLLEKNHIDDNMAAAAGAGVSASKSYSSTAAVKDQDQEFEIEGAGTHICNNVSEDDSHDEVSEADNTIEFAEELDSTKNDVVAADIEDDPIFKEADDDGVCEEKFETGEEELDWCANSDDMTPPEDDDDHTNGDGDGNANLKNAIEEEDVSVEFKLDPYQTENKNAAAECSVDGENDASYERFYRSNKDVLLDARVVDSDESNDFEIEANSEEQQDVLGNGVITIELAAIVELMATEEITLEEDKLAEKFSDMELNDLGVDPSSLISEAAGAPLKQQLDAVVGIQNKEKDLTNNHELDCSTEANKGEKAAAIREDSNESLYNNANINYPRSPVRNICSVSSPLLQKSVGRKTPSTSAKRMMMIKVSDNDNKENSMVGNSGTKLMMTTSPAKEKNENKGSVFLMDPQKGKSLRQLKKELRAQLENANNKKAASTRPALQALIEN